MSGSSGPRGLLVAIEGIDGAGTSTLAGTVARSLGAKGQAALLTHEPSDGMVGRYLRDILAGDRAAAPDPRTVALLFAADRRDHLDRVIEPALARGETVVTARYVLSSLAYQGCELGQSAWVEALNSTVRPADLTFLLDVPVELAAERRAARQWQEIYEHDDFLTRVRAEYRRWAQTFGAQVLDARERPEALAFQVVTAILALLASRPAGFGALP